MQNLAALSPSMASPLESEVEIARMILVEPEVHWRIPTPYRRTCVFAAGRPFHEVVGSLSLAFCAFCLLPFAACLRAPCCQV